jgi:hypothetical protein
MWVWKTHGYLFTHTGMGMGMISYPGVGMGPGMDAGLPVGYGFR